MIVLRAATDADFRAFFGKEPPSVWTALCGDRAGEIIGIGGVVYSDDGIAVAFVDVRERHAMTMHRAALRFMAVMKEVGEPVIYTACDEMIPRASAWLLRLGFKLLPDRVEDKEIWQWQPYR